MTNSYDVDHGLSQDAPGPLEPVEIAPTQALGIRVEIEPDPRGVSVGVWQGSHCIYSGAHPIPAAPGVSTVEDAGAQKEAVMDAVADALGDAYDCMRVWSAWGIGTMSQDDFRRVADDAGRLGELADAAIAAMRHAPAAGDALDARQLMALADAVVVQWQREDKMPQMAWGFREFLVAGMQALIDSNCTPHDGDGLVDALARLAYYYAVELESATRNADSDRLEEIARSITAKLKGEIRAAIAAQRKGDA